MNMSRLAPLYAVTRHPRITAKANSLALACTETAAVTLEITVVAVVETGAAVRIVNAEKIIPKNPYRNSLAKVRHVIVRAPAIAMGGRAAILDVGGHL
jgi:hypothetical protein